MSWSIVVVYSLVCDLVSNLAIKIVRAFSTANFNSGTEIFGMPKNVKLIRIICIEYPDEKPEKLERISGGSSR